MNWGVHIKYCLKKFIAKGWWLNLIKSALLWCGWAYKELGRVEHMKPENSPREAHCRESFEAQLVGTHGTYLGKLSSVSQRQPLNKFLLKIRIKQTLSSWKECKHKTHVLMCVYVVAMHQAELEFRNMTNSLSSGLQYLHSFWRHRTMNNLRLGNFPLLTQHLSTSSFHKGRLHSLLHTVGSRSKYVSMKDIASDSQD